MKSRLVLAVWVAALGFFLDGSSAIRAEVPKQLKPVRIQVPFTPTEQDGTRRGKSLLITIEVPAEGAAYEILEQVLYRLVVASKQDEIRTCQARQLIREGYQLLRANDLARARQLAEHGRDLHPALNWWEDNPEKLLADIDRQPPVKTNPTVQDLLLVPPRGFPFNLCLCLEVLINQFSCDPNVRAEELHFSSENIGQIQPHESPLPLP